jgi:NAD(P)-dependent dehydrogenase (short-subunit alcohol dehydrogenase family)
MSRPDRFTDKVVIVTGSGQGLGRVYAEGIAAEGGKVVVADINDVAGKETVARIVEAGGTAMFVHTDISSRASTEEMARQTAAEYGGIDVLLNNAAMYDGIEMMPFTDLDEDAWDRMFAVNVRGTWNCCKAVVPLLRERGTGTIVNIASTTALIGPPLLLHYTATKGAIVAITRALANELGEEGIRVTGCSPGVTYTQATNNIIGDPILGDIFVEMQAMKKKLQPEDVAPLVLFLCSDEAGMIVGQNYVVDGGWMKP